MPRNYQQLAPSVQFENQLASSLYSVGFILPGSRSTVGFITRDFHALISRHHSQTNRRGLYTLFLTSKSPCMQKISSVNALLSTQNVLSRSGRFGGHTGWSQLQLASSVSPLWNKYHCILIKFHGSSFLNWIGLNLCYDDTCHSEHPGCPIGSKPVLIQVLAWCRQATHLSPSVTWSNADLVP